MSPNFIPNLFMKEFLFFIFIFYFRHFSFLVYKSERYT